VLGPLKEFAAVFLQHGIAVILGAMLLSWGAWILHRMTSFSIGRR
jgi:hypothetical protein